MNSMWLDLAIAMTCGGGGLICGWIMHAIGGFGNHTLVRQAAATIANADAPEQPPAERVFEVADRLKAYAISMAADVDAHQTKVQAVNNSLLEGDEASPEAVIAAVNQLIEANEKMQTQLREAQDRIHEQTVQIETAERRAQTDALTRVPNRGAFDDHIKQRHDVGPGKAGTLALMDVDHFKKFNDVYGHRAGDEVLRIVANVLHARLQSYGLVARFGGEEFAVILDGMPIQKASALVEEARIAIGERDIQFENKSLRVAASMGVAELMPGESIEQWLQRADDALYHSKNAGRNCGHWMDATDPIRIELAEPPEVTRTADEKPEDPPAAPAPSGQAQAKQSADANKESKDGNPADETPKSSADRSAFAYLPDRKTLGESFEEIRGRTQANVSMFVMAIRCTSAPNNAMMRSLLQIVRATMRAVDRLGCEDESTILICMPSVDAATARQRGQQICQSAGAVAVATAKTDQRPLTVGVVEAGMGEDFDDVVSRAVTLTQQCLEQDQDCICLESQQATA